jgi:hypothetical protein
MPAARVDAVALGGQGDSPEGGAELAHPAATIRVKFVQRFTDKTEDVIA